MIPPKENDAVLLRIPAHLFQDLYKTLEQNWYFLRETSTGNYYKVEETPYFLRSEVK